MSKHSDLKVARDIARGTAARFVRKAAHHLTRASNPDFRKAELLLLAEARNHAQIYAAKADQISAMLKKRAARRSDQTI
jgi:hypothetical protein